MQTMRTTNTAEGYSYKSFDEYQCIFVHIPKTAGVSVCQSLFGNLAGSHVSMPTYQLVFSKSEFERYFKFTFVRNPWDRVLSAYNFLKKGGMNEQDRRWAKSNLIPYQSFEEFIKVGLSKPNVQKFKHFRPQYNFLSIPNGQELPVDFLGFFENIQDDFQYVASTLEIGNNLVLKRMNASSPGQKLDFRDFYTDSTRSIVAEVYKNDIDAFGYNFDNSSLPSQLKGRLQQMTPCR
jgi:hypothetical protein